MLTHHAQARMQQRCIPMSAVDALMEYGEARRHHGADVFFLTKRARCRLQKNCSKREFLQLEKALDAYLVVADDGAVITAGHRHHRLKF